MQANAKTLRYGLRSQNSEGVTTKELSLPGHTCYSEAHRAKLNELFELVVSHPKADELLTEAIDGRLGIRQTARLFRRP